MQIRPMLTVDLDRVAEVEALSMPSPWSKELFEEEIKRDLAYYFVAEEEGRILGYMGYWEAPQEAHIITLAVAPEARRRGIGKALVQYCMAYARGRGAELATLEVRQSNGEAQGLYGKCNFRVVAIRKAYYSDNQEDALVMYRELGLEDKAGS